MINETIGAIAPLIATTSGVLDAVKLLTGGLFGLYVLLVLLRVYEIFTTERRIKEIHRDIKDIRDSLKKTKSKH